jgi:hypothetical protein
MDDQQIDIFIVFYLLHYDAEITPRQVPAFKKFTKKPILCEFQRKGMAAVEFSPKKLHFGVDKRAADV